MIDEEDCDVRFPCKEAIWSLEYPFTSPLINEHLSENYVKTDSRFTLKNHGLFATFISIIAFLGRVSQYVNRTMPTCELPPWDRRSEFAKLENELEEWHRAMVIEYEYSKEKLNTFNSTVSGAALASVHFLYYAVVVVLNRPSVAKLMDLMEDDLQSISQMQLDFLTKAAEKCSAAAKHVTSIASDILHYGVQSMCPFTLYPVFATATIHINDMYNEDINIANVAKESLKIHKQYLTEMSPIWAMAAKMNYMMEDMCNVGNERSESACGGSAFFFDRNKNSRGRNELMHTGSDSGFVTFWNRANNNVIDTSVINNTLPTLPMGFPELSPRWLFANLNDASIDSWTSLLRSGSISPGTLRRITKKENDENEYDYFSQDIALYSGNSPTYLYETAPFFDMSIGQNLTPTNRQANKNWADVSSVDSIVQAASINPIPPLSNIGGSTISTGLVPIDTSVNLESSNVNDVNNQDRNREFSTAQTQRTTDIQIDPLLR